MTHNDCTAHTSMQVHSAVGKTALLQEEYVFLFTTLFCVSTIPIVCYFVIQR